MTAKHVDSDSLRRSIELDVLREKVIKLGLELGAEREAHEQLQARCFDQGGTFSNVFDEVRNLKRDILAYKAALGYSVPGDFDGRLVDGTTPHCGLCEARQKIIDRIEARDEARFVASFSDRDGLGDV